MTPTGWSAMMGLPVSSAFWEICRYCPCESVNVMGTPASSDGNVPASSVTMALVGAIVTCVRGACPMIASVGCARSVAICVACWYAFAAM